MHDYSACKRVAARSSVKLLNLFVRLGFIPGKFVLLQRIPRNCGSFSPRPTIQESRSP